MAFLLQVGEQQRQCRHVTLPHTWNTDTGGTGYFLETTANYQNNMYIPAEWATKRLFVKFYGVQSVADVFVNGYYVGGHKGGGTAFALEITDKIRFGSDNALLVVVSNNYCDDVLPTSTDMNLYGGIYREAELILTEKTAVSPLYLGSDGILVRQNSVGEDRVEGEAGDTPRHRRGEQLRPDARHHGARRQPRIFQTAEGAPRRETRHDSLLGRRPPVVEPRQPGPLPGIGEYRRRDRHRQRSRAYGFPQHRGDPGGRLCDQRHPHPDTRRNALPRQRHLGRRTHRARL